MNRLETLWEKSIRTRVHELMALDRGIGAEPWQEPPTFSSRFRRSSGTRGWRSTGMRSSASRWRAGRATPLISTAWSSPPRAADAELGRDLVLAVAASARASGLPRMTLKVQAGNREARVFYERLGFREEGRPAPTSVSGPRPSWRRGAGASEHPDNTTEGECCH